MRIIGGDLRRRKLLTPPDASVTRPMPDMVREALFNLLRGHSEGAAVLDAFAGTGAVGLEAISRGARHVVFVERDKDVAEILRANARTLGVENRAEVVVGDALGASVLARCPRPLHLVFFDPPYPMVRDAGVWKRVKGQFSRAIELLDDTGYGVLRTPWPFVHEAGGEEERPVRERKGKRGRERRWDWKREAQDGDELIEVESEEDIAEIDFDEFEGQVVEKVAPPPVEHTPGDLQLEGALGPETHVYGTMAVHLYMKKGEGQ